MIKRIVTAVVLIPLVLLLVLKAPLYVLAIVAAAVVLAAVAEFLRLVARYGVQPLGQATYAFVALFFVFVIVVSTNRTPLVETTAMMCGLALAAVAPFLFLTLAMRRRDLTSGYPAAAASVFAFAYIAVPMALLVGLRQQAAGAIYVIYTLLVVWAGDIFAFFIGKGLGRHRMSPEISPKKTWEGAVASILASVIVGTLWFQHAPGISAALLKTGLIERRDGIFSPQQLPPLVTLIVLSAVVNLAAQLGDLAESLLKRGAGVKDSGSILPGHGGMLDRIDAMLFAVPVVWAYSAWRLMQ
ncbi:MAG: phosphatidate cytidylyltransferase [Terriglobales bacterium]